MTSAAVLRGKWQRAYANPPQKGSSTVWATVVRIGNGFITVDLDGAEINVSKSVGPGFPADLAIDGKVVRGSRVSLERQNNVYAVRGLIQGWS